MEAGRCMVRRFIPQRLRLLALLPLVVTAFYQSPVICRAQEAESLEDAKVLYKQAIQEKAAGKPDEALLTYEKAIRMNRQVLSEDDNGLIGLLRTKYEAKLKETPDDIIALEGLGFVSAVCYSDMAKAISCYEKVLGLTTEEKVKNKTSALIERLKMMQEASSRITDEMASQMREERLKGWSEMEKQEKLAAQHEESQNRAAEYARLTQQRDELDTRIPQLEEEIKNLEEEYNKANRLWYTLKDDRYDRRRDRFEKDLEEKRKELSKARSDFDQASDKLTKMDREQPMEGTKPGNASGNAPSDEGNEPTPGAPPEPPGADMPGDNGPQGGSGDPTLPTGDNPDFPPQTGSSDGGNGDPLIPGGQTDSTPSGGASNPGGGDQPSYPK